MIPISKPFFNNDEKKYINEVIDSKILVDGPFQSKVEKIIEKKINSKSISLTQSCTHALEISAILLNIKLLNIAFKIKFCFVLKNSFNNCSKV